MSSHVIGLDIGGANLKAADNGGQARSQPYELWKNLAGLTDALIRLLEGWRKPDCFALTMTGELCDCFETKRQGVLAILEAVKAAAGETPVRVWTIEGQFVDLSTATHTPLPCAAANWLALATFAGRLAPRGHALLIDIGSTTTDVVPLRDGRPTPRGRTDRERLGFHELVYTGVRRTPLCALLGARAAAEFFATTLDTYLTLGMLAENAEDRTTADGRPATRHLAHARLARMLCGDGESVTQAETLQLARQVLLHQTMLIGMALASVVKAMAAAPETIIQSGSGEFLADLVVKERAQTPRPQVVSLGERLGPQISEAACAYAVAVLAAEEG